MCGITGFWYSRGGANHGELDNQVRSMVHTLRHRGPDDSGSWISEDAQIAMASARLAIIDPSSGGKQPMVSGDGHSVLLLNGEIYNHPELRADLQVRGYVFRGRSDTEVALAACQEWGVSEAASRFHGMFALALWDNRSRILHLCRDRIGEKPLYYGFGKDCFYFASELKALQAHPSFIAELDRQALALYLRFNFIPAPLSVYQGINKLLPGTHLTLGDPGGMVNVDQYWEPQSIFNENTRSKHEETESSITEKLHELLRRSVKSQLRADVPIGAFLSSGLDSSLIVALMQEQGDQKVKTYTLGYSEKEYDESKDAATRAAILGTDHTGYMITPEEVLNAIPNMADVYDEPFADSSQVPTYLLCSLASQDVSVALSGDGGDELFGGYSRHLWFHSHHRTLNRFPFWLRKLLGKALVRLSDFPPAFLKRISQINQSDYSSVPHIHVKLKKLGKLGQHKSAFDQYFSLLSTWDKPDQVQSGVSEPQIRIRNMFDQLPDCDFSEAAMFLDLMMYLPDDILVKVDRASMASSLEVRVPYLDHNIVEYSWTLPLSSKIRAGTSKHILRRILTNYFPQNLVAGPKRGFELPIELWLRGPLREWADDMLASRSLINNGLLNTTLVSNLWQQHRSGKNNWKDHMWNILMLQAWLNKESSAGCLR